MHVLELCFGLFKMDFCCKLTEVKVYIAVVTAQMIDNGCCLKALQRSPKAKSIGAVHLV
jgi:hypothetical protein